MMRRASLDSRLKTLKIDIRNDERVITLRRDIEDFVGKLDLNKSKTGLKTNNNLKSILKKENLFNIPPLLQCYSPFISDDSISINWIDWKTKGGQFDAKGNGICPYCADKFKPTYEEEKKVFLNTYKKADSQNLKNMLDLFTRFEKYLDPAKYDEVISCIKKDIDEETIKTLLTSFMLEFDYIKTQMDKIAQFDSNVFSDVDIKDLDKLLDSMKIQKVILNFFSSS